MAAWLSALIIGVGLGGLSSLSAGRVEDIVIDSLRDITPQRGDLVVLDVDDTLIHPVHSVMRGGASWARLWWRPMLPVTYDKIMSMAWCQDGRELVERTTHQTIREWRALGVRTIALSARSNVLPWQTDMATALCRQLAVLGIPFYPAPLHDSGLKTSGGLACTNGRSKHTYILQTARSMGAHAPAKVWVIDDRPDKEWSEWTGEESDPRICVALYRAAQEKAPSKPRLFEVLEMGYYLKTGRWPSKGLSCCPRAAGLVARTRSVVSPFRSG
jgi:hypothetical protein